MAGTSEGGKEGLELNALSDLFGIMALVATSFIFVYKFLASSCLFPLYNVNVFVSLRKEPTNPVQNRYSHL